MLFFICSSQFVISLQIARLETEIEIKFAVIKINKPTCGFANHGFTTQ